MKLEIEPAKGATHRGGRYKRHVLTPGKYDRINKLDVAVIETRSSSWWIVPVWCQHEALMVDIGPFETAELAWSTLQLLKD